MPYIEGDPAVNNNYHPAGSGFTRFSPLIVEQIGKTRLPAAKYFRSGREKETRNRQKPGCKTDQTKRAI